MNRDDWVFVGMRLLGLYELLDAVIDFPIVVAGLWNVPGAPVEPSHHVVPRIPAAARASARSARAT